MKIKDNNTVSQDLSLSLIILSYYYEIHCSSADSKGEKSSSMRCGYRSPLIAQVVSDVWDDEHGGNSFKIEALETDLCLSREPRCELDRLDD